MKKVFWVAWRELTTTVLTKGFLIGVLAAPLAMGLLVFLMPRLMDEKAPAIRGEVAVLDPTGEVGPAVADLLAPETLAARRVESLAAVREAVPESVKPLVEGEAARRSMEDALTDAMGEVPSFTVTVESGPGSLDAALEGAKARLVSGADRGSGEELLAVVVVHPDAVDRDAGRLEYGSYDLFVREKLDDRVSDEIHYALRRALVDARAERFEIARDELRELVYVPRVSSVTVTAGGERATLDVANILLPVGFMVLLIISVMTSGQYLMTTVIEEKSSRVVEVLLSAVSPMELMTGKILGQLGVGFLVLGLYLGLGIVALVSFALLGVLDVGLLAYLFLFYLVSFFTLASLMAAVGAAVNELREAQTLMLPIILLVMVPWMFWLPISRNPDSALAVSLSFLPPVNAFVMLLRLTSTSPPPTWQVWLSLAVGAAGAWAAVWLAAKVFRVGLLMYGKPPDLKTLLHWIRMA